jgi:hypothetical protein
MSFNDVKKKMFITKMGLYECLVMPWTMMIIFYQWLQQFINFFVDDLNIHNTTWEKHLTHVHMVFQWLRDMNLKLNPNKCMFSIMNIIFWGT